MMPYPLIANTINSTKTNTKTYDSINATFELLSEFEALKLCSVFNLPRALENVQPLFSLLPLFHKMCCELSPASNSYWQSQQDELGAIIKKLHENKTDVFQKNWSTQSLSRNKLHTYLTDYPLYSTLVLIAVNHPHDDESVHWWTLLTARLYLLHPEKLYPALLALDKARSSCQDMSSLQSQITLSDLYELTYFELKQAFDALREQSTDVTDLVKHLIRKPTQQRKKQDTLQRLTGDTIDVDNSTIQTRQYVDEQGEIRHQHLEISSQVPLTKKAQQQHFKRKIAGAKNAMRCQNLNLPHSQHALTPFELKAFLSHALPELTNGDFHQLDMSDIWGWIVCFLEIWFGLPYDRFKTLKLINQRSKKLDSECLQPGFHYHLTDDNQCHIHLVIEQRLVIGKLPQDISGSSYYPNQAVSGAIIVLPYPLQSLLNLALRATAPNQRNQCALQQVIQLDDKQYKVWVNSAIKPYNIAHLCHVKHTQIRHSFHHFASGQVPDVSLKWLQGEAIIEHYYTSADCESLKYILQVNWLAFTENLGFILPPHSTLEADQLRQPETKNALQSFGAGLVITNDTLTKLAKIFYTFFSKHQAQRKEHLVKNKESISKVLASYLGIRLSLSGALRPVKQPLPMSESVAFDLGLFTVQDKDAHRNGEHRLIFIDEFLRSLWLQWQRFYKTSSSLLLSEACTLAYLEKNHWHSVNKESFQQLLTELVIDIDSNSFRQTSFSQHLEKTLFTDSTSVLNQRQLNLHMNHYKLGQSLLSQFNLASPFQLQLKQQAQSQSAFAMFKNSDSSCAALLSKLTKLQGAI